MNTQESMTREAFISKWVDTPLSWDETKVRDQMRSDLNKLIAEGKPALTEVVDAVENWFSKTFEDGEALQWPTEYHTSLLAALKPYFER